MASPCTTLALVALLAGPFIPLASAAPAEMDFDPITRRGPGDFSITEVRNENYTGPNGLQAMLRTYAKYNVALTPELQYALENNPTILENSLGRRHYMQGVVGVAPPYGNDYEFLAPVQIGTPGQTLKLNFDTGSSDLWVFSTDTPSSQVAGQTLYQPAKSTTSRKVPSLSWKIRYGDGTGASGIVYQDKVQVGNAFYMGQVVESATQVSSQFTADAPSSGLLGLAFSTGNQVTPTPQKTFFDNIKPYISNPLFTANLKHGTAGTYNFGFINPNEYTGAITYTPIDTTSIYWKFTPTGYQIGSNSLSYIPTTSWTTIADTGTSLMLLPDDMVSRYYATLPGSAYDPNWAAILFPCKLTAPDFTFGIGSYRATVPGRYINFGPVNSTYCYGGIQSSSPIGMSIFGAMTLKAQFVVFDAGNSRLGFANKTLP